MPSNTSTLITHLKKYKKTYIFLGIVFCYVFYDAFFERQLKSQLGARIYVLFQDISPENARKLVIDAARKNPELSEFRDIMTYDDPVVWSRMFVCKDEYFFPLRWPKTDMTEEGYYVNPRTKEVRYVNNNSSYSFFWPFDAVSIDVTDSKP